MFVPFYDCKIAQVYFTKIVALYHQHRPIIKLIHNYISFPRQNKPQIDNVIILHCFIETLNISAPEVIQAIRWSENLDSIFMNNYRVDPSLSWQYFGSSTGFMRHYPGDFKRKFKE